MNEELQGIFDDIDALLARVKPVLEALIQTYVNSEETGGIPVGPIDPLARINGCLHAARVAARDMLAEEKLHEAP